MTLEEALAYIHRVDWRGSVPGLERIDALLGKPTLWRVAVAVFPAAIAGSVLWQSMALALVYGGEAKMPFFLTRLAARSVQFAVTACIDTVLVWLLARRDALAPALHRMKTKGREEHDA